MSVSNIQSNISAMLSKAYNTDASSTAAEVSKPATTQNGTASDSVSASALVTLGTGGTASGTYTAQGLMQQLRQYQLSNAALMFGSDAENNQQDTTGIAALMGQTDSANLESLTQDWVSAISENPGKASVMVASSQNNSISTLLGSSS